MALAPRRPRIVQRHIDEALANYGRYERMLEQPADESWAEVFLFYSAIHLIQAHAHDKTPHDIPYNHEGRRSYVVDYMPDEIAQSYYRLDDVSMAVRYRLRRLTRTQIRAIHDDHFAKIRRHLREQGIAWVRPDDSSRETSTEY